MGGKAHVVLSLAPGAHQVMELSQSLFRRGVFVQGLRFPTVAPGKERLRWTVTAAHTPEHVERALRCYEDVLCAAQHQADNERIGTAP